MILHEDETTKDVLRTAERARDLRGEVTQLKAEIARLTAEAEELHLKAKEDQEKISLYVSETTLRLEEMEQQKEALVSGHRKELEALRGEVTLESNHAIAYLESSVSDYRDAVAAAETALAEEKSRSDVLAKEIAKLTRELERSQGRESGAASEAESLRSDLAQLQRLAAAQVSVNKGEWEQRLMNSIRETEVEYARAEKAELQLREATEGIEQLRGQNSLLNKSLSKTTNDLKKEKLAREALTTKLGEYDQQLRGLQDKMEETAEAHRRDVALARIGQEAS